MRQPRRNAVRIHYRFTLVDSGLVARCACIRYETIVSEPHLIDAIPSRQLRTSSWRIERDVGTPSAVNRCMVPYSAHIRHLAARTSKLLPNETQENTSTYPSPSMTHFVRSLFIDIGKCVWTSGSHSRELVEVP